MSAQIHVIPVEGITAIPDIEAHAEERNNDCLDFILLSVSTALAILTTSCAWILLALD